MPNKKQPPFLTQDIQLVPLPASVKKLLGDAGFRTLKDFLKLPYYKWESSVPGLTASYRKQIVTFLFNVKLQDHMKVD